MARAPAPEALTLPLPGGRDGASVRVHPLLGGEAHAPPGYLVRRPGPLAVPRSLLSPRSRWFWLPVPSFLIEHPTAGHLLVDTGLHRDIAEDPRGALGALPARIFRGRLGPGGSVATQLEARGIPAGEVPTVIMTHLHWDHTGGMVDFPESSFVVDRHEWEAAHTEGLRGGYIAHSFAGARWQPVDFDAPEVESMTSFGRTLDLLGDGSIRLISTPGHTRGHLSVLLRLSAGELLVTGDAAFTRETIARDLLPLFVPDEHNYLRSLFELRRYTELTPEAVVIPGHDPELWPTLADRYD